MTKCAFYYDVGYGSAIIQIFGSNMLTFVTAPASSPEPPLESESEEEYTPRTVRSKRGMKRGHAARGRKPKRQRTRESEMTPVEEVTSTKTTPADADKYLKFTYGVNAWKHWVLQKNAQMERVKKRGSGKLKLFKTDLLECSSDELNYTLCLFVKEVRKPNSEEYACDSIHYLCLGKFKRPMINP